MVLYAGGKSYYLTQLYTFISKVALYVIRMGGGGELILCVGNTNQLAVKCLTAPWGCSGVTS